ncbi:MULTISPECIES: NAD(P)/FAD-dependent oxidoreductase [Subtercola]|uniref:Pyridine nucleotide-disulfide oxidoreductase n=1 Tax=Subtercola vilae TaxID=2056433 RepID=A0A4T2C391_9MICO|nr:MULTISPECIES: FAD-dependent oxidoreductase [Subtercola]MEA9984108.1 FAD-dependent oxidoreductase [Subtercola sp. RTI3]TIH38735.1 pyridine nucleotide-disulfide oxidoreductase [Subtercola vilae]
MTDAEINRQATPVKQRVLILGGGYAGLYVALGLQKHRGETPVEIIVVDRNPYMTYQPLLPEVAGGHVAASDVAISLRQTLRGSRVIRGQLAGLDIDTKQASIADFDGGVSEIDYDHVVFALGAVTRVFDTPGLKENAVGFKTIEEAVYTHNRVLEQVALAASYSVSGDEDARAKALTFVVVGGGYTGVEALSELSDLSKIAVAANPSLDASELHWVLIEALDRVAPEVGPELSKWSLQQLRERGIDVRLKTTITSAENGDIVLDSGETIPANTIIWTAGVQPNPALNTTNAPRGPKGHVVANVQLQVVRDDGTPVEGAWAVGDNAQIPDLTATTQPAYYPPNAQNALRQGVLLAQNILASIRGGELTEYRHASLGTVAGYGVGHGAALIKGVKLRGLPAWAAHRGYHGLVIPTLNRKVRVIAGWLVEAVTSRETVALPGTEHPRRIFEESFDALKKH